MKTLATNYAFLLYGLVNNIYIFILLYVQRGVSAECGWQEAAKDGYKQHRAWLAYGNDHRTMQFLSSLQQYFMWHEGIWIPTLQWCLQMRDRKSYSGVVTNLWGIYPYFKFALLNHSVANFEKNSHTQKAKKNNNKK